MRRKRTKNNAKQRKNPESFKVELPVEEEQHHVQFPASALAELAGLDNNKKYDRSELAHTGIIELSDEQKSELP